MTEKIVVKIIKHSGIAAIDALITQAPQLLPIWIMMKGFFGAAAELRIERAVEYIELFQTMPKIILDDKYFQDGVVNLVPNYLSQRNAKKREVVRALVNRFSQAENLEQFELERFNQVIYVISIQSLEFLEKHREGVIKSYIQHCKDDAKRTQNTPEQIERWITINMNSGIAFSVYYDKYVRETFGLDSVEFKRTQNGTEEEKRPGLEKFGQVETELLYDAADIFNELAGLGIMKAKTGDVSWGGGSNINYFFTDFGLVFLELLV